MQVLESKRLRFAEKVLSQRNIPNAEKKTGNQRRKHEEESALVPAQPTVVDDNVINDADTMIGKFLDEIHDDFTGIEDNDVLHFFVYYQYFSVFI